MPQSHASRGTVQNRKICPRSFFASSTTSSGPLVAFKRPPRQSQDRKARRNAFLRSSSASVQSHDTSRASAAIPRSESCDVVGHDSSDNDAMQHVIMAVDVKERGTIGCAYYMAQEEKLFCMDDIASGNFEMVERLKFDIQPTTLIVSARLETMQDHYSSNASLFHCQRQTSLVNDDESVPLPYKLELRPTADFSYESAKNRLMSIATFSKSLFGTQFLVPGDDGMIDDHLRTDQIGFTNHKAALLRISTCVDLDCKVSVGCMGAVLNHLHKRRSSEYLQDDPDVQSAYKVSELEMFTMKNTMFTNADTLTALQIIQPESHPNSSYQGPGTGGTKESLSIFGLFLHHARTTQGRARLRQFFLRPLLDKDTIDKRLDLVSTLTLPDNQIAARQLSKSLGRIKNMRSTINLLHKGVENSTGKSSGIMSGVWSSLLEFCYHSIDIAEILRTIIHGEGLPLLVQLFEVLDRFNLQRIGKMIHDVVDLELSAEQGRTVVKRGIDDALDKVKNAYDGMSGMLGRVARDISQILPSDDIEINVIFFPQLGFHITVPIDPTTGDAVFDGIEHGWVRKFTTQHQVYFKDDKMRDMDNELGDIYASICDVEIEIAHDLGTRVLQDEKMLLESSDLCGELDCILALAHCAVEHNLRRPTLTIENVIDIKQGRHLLQEMTVPSYVPNDSQLRGGTGPSDIDDGADFEVTSPTMILLTGPNYSGKSVYQKQVALIVFMAHIGSFVPADSATIGITDKILTRIATRETVTKAQSAFMIDIQQMSAAVNASTHRSLIIIDEFGKGTDSCDGAGLAAGVLSHLLQLGNSCPKVVAATHFHELFDIGALRGYTNLAVAHMEVLLNNKMQAEGHSPTSEVTCLYGFKLGRSDQSYGTQCAAMNGIPNQIITRATKLTAYMIEGQDLVSICSALSEREYEDLREAETTARAFLNLDLEETIDCTTLLRDILA